MGDARRTVHQLFGHAGIEFGGHHPWDIQVRDERFYERILAQGSLGFGDSYVEGWWDCERVDELICRILSADIEEQVGTDWRIHVQLLKAKLTNLQRPSRAPDVASHYDVGNGFYERLLGPTMAYSCAYWRRAEDLDAAQTAKFELIAQKLDVQPGDHVADIGCGWGGLARHLARTRGCRVTAVTISEPQATYAREICRGLPVDVIAADYRTPEVRHRGP
jgi:cyclopropane-fatty-acyl-phospholipid synthase